MNLRLLFGTLGSMLFKPYHVFQIHSFVFTNIFRAVIAFLIVFDLKGYFLGAFSELKIKITSHFNHF